MSMPRPLHAQATIYIPIPSSRNDTNSTTTTNVTITSLSGFPRHAYRVDVTTTNATDADNAVRVLVPRQQHHRLVKVTKQAVAHHCQVAVNGGPFHADGTSVGVLVVNGKVVQSQSDAAQLVGFGRMVMQPRMVPPILEYNNSSGVDGGSTTTNTSLAYWIFGAPPQNLTDGVQFYVTGFGWLVRNGQNVATPDDDDNGGALRAPRTAVGVNADGHLVFVVADGCEKW